jgi:hypothetical protein
MCSVKIMMEELKEMVFKNTNECFLFCHENEMELMVLFFKANLRSSQRGRISYVINKNTLCIDFCLNYFIDSSQAEHIPRISSLSVPPRLIFCDYFFLAISIVGF